MGDSMVLDKFDKDELDAIQWDSLDEEMSRSLDYQVVASYAELNEAYNAANAAKFRMFRGGRGRVKTRPWYF